MHLRHHLPSSAAIACVLALVSPLAVSADVKAKAAPTAPADAAATSSPSYGAGLQVGESLNRVGVTTELDLAAFMRGVKDALGGKVATPEERERVNQFVAQVRSRVLERNRTAAREFLTKNAAEKGVVSTASGLQYKVLAAGDDKAASPAPADKVTVQYRGKLLDGTEFDSSYSRGTPATFQVNGVIKGWQEALVLMKPGARWQLYIPPELAYDANSRPPIPPGSLLVFDVELVGVAAPGESK
jgi:FKBP-type peptidyl-prolyl cis-trans isomerase FklB